MTDTKLQLTSGFRTLFLLFIVTAVLLGRANRMTVTEYGVGDDDDYWSYGISLVYDGDFDFSNEPLPTFLNNPGFKNYHSPIPGVLWTPAVALGRTLGPVISRLPGKGKTGWERGVSQYHRLLVSAYSGALSLAGLFILYAFLMKFFPPREAFLATIIGFWSGPLMFFTFRRPLMAHSAEFVLLAASAWLFHSYFTAPRRGKAFGAGILFMFSVLARYPNAAMMGALALGLAWQTQGWKQLRRDALVIGAGMLLPLAIQVAAWHAINGTFSPPSVGGGGSGQYAFTPDALRHNLGLSGWTLGQFGRILWGRDWGLLWAEPAVFAALLAAFIRPVPWGKLRLCLGVALFPYLLIAANFGSQGGSYGQRYFLVKVLWLVLNFGIFLQLLKNRKYQTVLTALFCAISIVPYVLYASGPAELTLSVAPSARPGFSDWVNPSFLLNAWTAVFVHPVQFLYGLFGAPLPHAIVWGAYRIFGAGVFPETALPKIMERVIGVPMPDLVWFVGWQLVFSSAAYAVARYLANRYVPPASQEIGG